MRRHSGEKCLRALVMKAMRNRSCRRRRGKAEARHQPGMFRNRRHWTENIRRELCPVLNEWLDHFAPGAAVFAERRSCLRQVALEYDCGSIVEGMCKRRRRLDPLQSEVSEGQGREERRSRSQRMHGGPEVVQKSGKGERH